MSVCSGRTKDRRPQFQLVDDRLRSKIEHVLQSTRQLLVGQFPGPEGVDKNRHRPGNADRVGELNLAARGHPGVHEVARRPAGSVCRRPIDLGRILPAERATTVPAHAAVRVDDDLPTGQSGIPMGPTDHKTAGRIDVKRAGVGIEKIRGNDGKDHFANDTLANGVDLHVGRVLGAHHNGLHRPGSAVFIRDTHLRFAVRSDPG